MREGMCTGSGPALPTADCCARPSHLLERRTDTDIGHTDNETDVPLYS